jgi:hypothetical protein
MQSVTSVCKNKGKVVPLHSLKTGGDLSLIGSDFHFLTTALGGVVSITDQPL